jgi:hypothetical protein
MNVVSIGTKWINLWHEKNSFETGFVDESRDIIRVNSQNKLRGPLVFLSFKKLLSFLIAVRKSALFLRTFL